MHPASEQILRYFNCAHLPPALADIARPFEALAQLCASRLDGRELTVGLRKLLEARDCMVRAALPVAVASSVDALPPSAEREADDGSRSDQPPEISISDGGWE